jgi:hypothetical protein
MVIRYVTLAALGAASIWALVTVGASNSEWLLADTGHAGSERDIVLWLLAAIATLIAFSLGRFLVFGQTSMVDGWYEEHKGWIYTVLGGGLAYAAYRLM